MQIAVSSVSLPNSQVDTSFIKNLMYEFIPSVREMLDDRTKDGGTNIQEGEQAWKAYTQ